MAASQKGQHAILANQFGNVHGGVAQPDRANGSYPLGHWFKSSRRHHLSEPLSRGKVANLGRHHFASHLPSPSMKNVPFKSREGLYLISILILTYLVFIPCLNNSFVNWDDPELIMGNPLIREFSLTNIKEIFTAPLTGKYYPLTIFSFMVEVHFFDLNPLIHHITNVVIHSINVVFVFWFLKQLGLSTAVTALATLLFGIHPMQVESVAWVSGRKDVLFAAFYLLALINYLKTKEGGGSEKGSYFLCMALFILSFFSKAMAITFPAALLCVDYFQNGKLTKSDVTEKLPFFILSFIFGLVTIQAANAANAFPTGAMYSLLEKIMFSCFALLLYVVKLLAPYQLSCFYPLPERAEGFSALILYLSPIIVFAALVLLAKKDQPVLTKLKIPMIFFILSMLPVLHLIKMNDSLIYERFVYLPSIGIFLLMAAGMHHLWNLYQSKPAIRLPVTALIIFYFLFLGLLTSARCQVWKTGETLWSDVINKYPQLSSAYIYRGAYYSDTGNYHLALADFNHVVTLDPDNELIFYNRAHVHVAFQKYDAAISDYTTVLSLNPQNIKAYNNRGNLFSTLRQYDLALKDYAQALSLDPGNVLVLLNRGLLYYKKGESAKALEDFRLVLDIHPENTFAMKMFLTIQEELNR